MITCFVFACLVTLAMLVWFKSDAVIEYASLLRLKTLVRDFKDARIEAAPQTFNFPHYLKKKYDCWLTRMLYCPLCFCVCFTVAIISGITILLLKPVILVAIPVICVMALVMYGVITRLLPL